MVIRAGSYNPAKFESFQVRSRAQKKRKHPEDDLQKTVVQWLRLIERKGDFVMFSIPNEGARTPAAAQRLKNLGRRSGMPDIGVIFRNGRIHFIELKSKSGTLMPNQRLMHDALRAMGCDVAVCRTFEEVQGTVAAWMVGLRRAA